MGVPTTDRSRHGVVYKACGRHRPEMNTPLRSTGQIPAEAPSEEEDEAQEGRG